METVENNHTERKQTLNQIIPLDSFLSPNDLNAILQILNRAYPVKCDRLTLHRDMIGFVYIATSGVQKYVLKLYRSFDTENALRAAGIMEYLQQSGYPVATILPTATGERHITMQTTQGPAAAILFEFVEGAEPDFEQDMEQIGQQAGLLHRIMEGYPEPLIYHGKDFYVDRYIAILHELNYPAGRIDALDVYGSALWGRMERLPRGFCHGDFHSGNMRKTEDGAFVLFDFDAASHTCSTIDVATTCDGSNFNRFDAAAYERTLRRFDRFYHGYRCKQTLTDAEIRGIFDFIPVRHYEIIATITRCQGLEELSTAFLDEQYDWLMRWQDLCGQRAV